MIFKACRPKEGFEYNPLKRPLGIYLVALLVADFVQVMGSILEAKWLAIGGVVEGPYCEAEGAMQNFGEVMVAMTNFAISVTTFLNICFEDSSYLSHPRHGRDKRWIPCLVIATIWTISALFAGLGYVMSHRSDYFGLVGYWCWINGQDPNQQIFLEYIWMWITAFFNFLIYVPIFLSLWSGKTIKEWARDWKKNRNAGPHHIPPMKAMQEEPRLTKLRLVFPSAVDTSQQNPDAESVFIDMRLQQQSIVHGMRASSVPSDRRPAVNLEVSWTTTNWRRTEAITVLAFPICYFIQVFPLSVSRFCEFHSLPVPVYAVGIGSAVFGFTGLIDVLLCILARKILLDYEKTSVFDDDEPHRTLLLTDGQCTFEHDPTELEAMPNGQTSLSHGGLPNPIADHAPQLRTVPSAGGQSSVRWPDREPFRWREASDESLGGPNAV